MQNAMAVEKDAPVLRDSIPVSVKGQWIDVPVLHVNGQEMVTRGKWIKIAQRHDEDWMDEEVNDPEACIRELKQISGAARPDIFCFSQRVPDVAPRYPYPMERRSIAVADVSNYKAWLKKLSESTRLNIKKAVKRGVVVKVRGLDPDVVEGIREIQNETRYRQGRPYWHYGKSFAQVQRDHGAFLERSDFLCAYYQDELIGFLKLVYVGGVASILQMTAKMAYYDKRTSDALVDKAVQLCEEKGIPYLLYDLFNYGNKADSSLREFKERHGFAEMLVPIYYVPLTLWGRFCVKARLYRGIYEIAPRSLINAALKIREKWYKLNGR